MTKNDPHGYGLAAVWVVFTLILTHTDMPHWMMMLCFSLLSFGISSLTGKK